MEDKRKIFKSSVEPLMNKILSVCNENGIPFFMVFGTNVDKDGKYELAAQSMIPEEFHYKEKDRRFSDFVNVMNGFETVPKKVENNIFTEDDFSSMGYGEPYDEGTP